MAENERIKRQGVRQRLEQNLQQTTTEVMERAALLLPPSAISIIQHWKIALCGDGNFFEYGLEGTSEHTILKAEELADRTLDSLIHGNFDYRKWFRHTPIHNVLSLLLDFGEQIPEGNTELLKWIAIDKLRQLEAASSYKRGRMAKQKFEFFVDYYGLGEAPPFSRREIAQKYGVSSVASVGSLLSFWRSEFRRILRGEDDEL
jgi:hypothetical protein